MTFIIFLILGMYFQGSTGQVTVIQTPTEKHVQNGQTVTLTCKTSTAIGRQSDGHFFIKESSGVTLTQPKVKTVQQGQRATIECHIDDTQIRLIFKTEQSSLEKHQHSERLTATLMERNPMRSSIMCYSADVQLYLFSACFAEGQDVTAAVAVVPLALSVGQIK
ncbi:hypothetical protein Q8A67_025637 [Cirrhinus molitorella]|uniref:Ig-like domain-containing protein n=1 Tax=Cirrhinus molitorella TaxID=172907 RepID=A0AA88NXY8_9TELE|nr:hypothetical protein Q8A67_025637 [Cirrhinus molitorella]